MALIKGNNYSNVIDGTYGDDDIYAYGGNDTVYGYGGYDLIDGGSGNDTLFGDGGDDDIFGGSGVNTLFGGSGSDWFRMSTRTNVLSDDYIADFQLGLDKIDLRAWGVSDCTQAKMLLADTVEGGSLFNALYGGVNHIIEVEDVRASEFIASDFVFNTSTSARTLNGTSSSDVLFGGRGHDLLDGNGGKDKLLGGVGDDDIYGEAGNDQIWGGAGSDLMSGGIGDDLFRFASVSEMTSSSGRDIITDFQINDGVGYDDRIDFSRIDADPTRPGNQAFDFIGRDTFITYSPGELRYYYDSNGDTVVSGNIDNDPATEFQIVLEGHHVLAASDFIL